jgi:phosphatidylinositol-bisphosphatase
VFASKAKWEKQVKEHLGETDYVIAGSHTLNAIHVMVLLHRYVWKYSWDIRTAQVATGFANLIGNKGGTQVSFNIGKTSLLFTNCHLAAHQDKMKERTENMRRILQESPLRRCCKPSNKESKYSKAAGIHEEFDRVFLFGDLNPRLNAERSQVDEWLQENAMSKLLDVDQLLPLLHGTGPSTGITSPRSTEGDVLWSSFKEQKIEFPPTYKFDKNTDDYDSGKKQRVPSWTDRILWKEDDGIKALSYGSVSSMYVSDHRPVYAQFEANVDLDNWDGPTTQEQSSVCSIQ